MKDCWSESPEGRPELPAVRNRLKPMRNGMKPNIMDQMVEMLEKYSNNLEVSGEKLTFAAGAAKMRRKWESENMQGEEGCRRQVGDVRQQ